MVQIVRENRRPSTTERFGAAFGALGNAIPGFMQARESQSQSLADKEALRSATGLELNNPDLQKIGLQQHLSGKNQMMRYQNEQQERHKVKDSLIESGIDEPTAELIANLNPGARTAYVNKIIEDVQRSGGKIGGSSQEEQSMPNDQRMQENPQVITSLSNKQRAKQDYEKYISEKDKGTTPSEKFKLGTERYKTGLPKYDEARTKLSGMTRDRERLDILEKLNGSDKLPKDFGRLNLDEDGNLRFPFAASSESQRFVKTLNEFSAGAKDTYGSRVTNFDLQQYLRRYPTLMNSEKGRKQILQQMKIVNEINSTYYKNLKKAFDKAGGVRNVDSDRAESYAEAVSEEKISKLVNKFDDIGTIPTLPNPSEFKGKKIRDKKTGEVLVSDGQDWLPE